MSKILASTPAVLKDGTLAPWFRDLLLSILNATEENSVRSLDGGFANSTYLASQSVDGGGANG